MKKINELILKMEQLKLTFNTLEMEAERFENWDITILSHRQFIDSLVEVRRYLSEAMVAKRFAKLEFDVERENKIQELINPMDDSKPIKKTPAKEQVDFLLANEKAQIEAMDIYLAWYLDEWNTLHRHLTSNQLELSKVDNLIEKKANLEVEIDEI